MEQVDLVVIGAGWHGLIMAKTYLEANADRSPRIAIFDESASVGGTWAEERLYHGLKTNNVVGSYEFSDFPMDLDRYGLKPGQHIPGAVVHRYLTDFTRQFGLDSFIQLRTKVDAAALRDDKTWLLEYSASSPMDETITKGQLVSNKLVVATGLTSEPYMPTFPGHTSFRGHLFHAKELYSRSRELESSQNVLVVGGNKSAFDVCYTAAACGAQVHMVMRPSGGGPNWVWRPLRFGFGSLTTTISRLSSTRFFTWFDPNPFGSVWLAVRHFLHRSLFGEMITSAFWAGLDRCLESTVGYRDGRLRMLRPWTSTFWMGNSLSVHNYESDWFELVRKGQVVVHHADVDSLDETTVHLSNGESLEADTVVCCTGWKCAPTVQFKPDGVAINIGLPNAGSSNGQDGTSDTSQSPTINSTTKGLDKNTRSSRRDNAAFSSNIRKQILENCPRLGLPPTRLNPGYASSGSSTKEFVVSITQSDSTTQKTEQSPYQLYRFLVPPKTPFLEMRNLAFIGAHRSLHAVVVAQAQALWITAFFQDRLPPLDATRVRHETALHTEYQRLRRPKETGGSGARFPDLVFDSIPYVDLLLQDLGMRAMRKRTLLGNLFEPHTVRDYQGLVPEWKAASATVATV